MYTQTVYIEDEKGGRVVEMDNDVLTGKKGVFDTPTGIWRASAKEKDKYMTNVKYGYNCHTNYAVRVGDTSIYLHELDSDGSYGDTPYHESVTVLESAL